MARGLGLVESLRELLTLWEKDEETHRRYDPAAPGVPTLRRCRLDLERLIEEAAPEWVPLGTVAANTGWSRKKLRADFRELAAEFVPGTETPLARMSPRWELHRSALDRILPKPGRSVDVASTEDLESLSRKLAAEGEPD